MRLPSWGFLQAVSQRLHRARKKVVRKGYRPVVEELEDRCTPAVLGSPVPAALGTNPLAAWQISRNLAAVPPSILSGALTNAASAASLNASSFVNLLANGNATQGSAQQRAAVVKDLKDDAADFLRDLRQQPGNDGDARVNALDLVEDLNEAAQLGLSLSGFGQSLSNNLSARMIAGLALADLGFGGSNAPAANDAVTSILSNLGLLTSNGLLNGTAPGPNSSGTGTSTTGTTLLNGLGTQLLGGLFPGQVTGLPVTTGTGGTTAGQTTGGTGIPSSALSAAVQGFLTGSPGVVPPSLIGSLNGTTGLPGTTGIPETTGGTTVGTGTLSGTGLTGTSGLGTGTLGGTGSLTGTTGTILGGITGLTGTTLGSITGLTGATLGGLGGGTLPASPAPSPVTGILPPMSTSLSLGTSVVPPAITASNPTGALTPLGGVVAGSGLGGTLPAYVAVPGGTNLTSLSLPGTTTVIGSTAVPVPGSASGPLV